MNSKIVHTFNTRTLCCVFTTEVYSFQEGIENNIPNQDTSPSSRFY